jgi:hypothetical protein
MDYVLSFRHTQGRDMRERLSRPLYSRIISDPGLQIRRIKACIGSVEASDGSGIHLRFSFTNFYHHKKSYTCVIWPRDETPVKYVLNDHDTVLERSRTKLLVEVDQRQNKVRFGFGGSSREYVFCEENPYQPHRPYFPSNLDAIIDSTGKDEAKVVEYHLPRILEQWKSLKERGVSCGGGIDSLFASVDSGRIADIHSILRDVSFHLGIVEDKLRKALEPGQQPALP